MNQKIKKDLVILKIILSFFVHCLKTIEKLNIKPLLMKMIIDTSQKMIIKSFIHK